MAQDPSVFKSKHVQKDQRIKNGNHQNAAAALSYEDENGELFFLVGQPQKDVYVDSDHKILHPTLKLWPFAFPGGQVDVDDVTEVKNKGYKSLPKTGAITSINQYGAARELKEETGIDIEILAQLLEFKMVQFNKQKAFNTNQTHYYHVHLGKIGAETSNALRDIIKQHMRNGKADDLRNVQFIHANILHREIDQHRDKSKYLQTRLAGVTTVIETAKNNFEDFYYENVNAMIEIRDKFARQETPTVKKDEDIKLLLIDDLQAHILKKHYEKGDAAKAEIVMLLKLINFLKNKKLITDFAKADIFLLELNIWEQYQSVPEIAKLEKHLRSLGAQISRNTIYSAPVPAVKQSDKIETTSQFLYLCLMEDQRVFEENFWESIKSSKQAPSLSLDEEDVLTIKIEAIIGEKNLLETKLWEKSSEEIKKYCTLIEEDSVFILQGKFTTREDLMAFFKIISLPSHEFFIKTLYEELKRTPSVAPRWEKS